ncbi:hypothetical protein ACJIZ3_016870 [Penstemon smallii]|uniref:CRIB domain-containing protein n=1 Tax=Penstemon smallii TaxID=265156 RepID=A0ABD3SUB8_9LAMI
MHKSSSLNFKEERMTTKMKGLLKGLRYISQIFDEEKEAEIQIGYPTDVKHVAHIGWDGGPSVDSPSWMKDFKSPTHSAPLDSPGDSRGDPEIKWVSEDSRRGNNRAPNSPGSSSDLPELPKSSRRHSSTDNNDSPRKKDSSTKSRRKHNANKESSSESSSLRSARQLQELSLSTNSSLPDIPKKSRRKKSKESNSGSGSSRTRSKGTTNSSYSDPGQDTGSILRTSGSHLSPVPSLNDDEDKDRRAMSKEY